jgi:acetyl esterase/lipase
VSNDRSPHLEIQPVDALIDAPVFIRLSGFPAGQKVTLHAQMPNYLGCAWTSHAAFVTDAQGCVDVGTQRPVVGTYELPDSMGLFWSMTPATGAEPRGYASASIAPLHVQFKAEVNGSTVTSQTVERWPMATDVSRTEVRDEGLVATLFRPPASGRRPAIITVGGSSGGLWETPAALLASHGFVTLALAYFGIPPLPPGLAEIPLEYFGTAIRWLQRQREALPQSLAVLGPSRGGELALLLGATFPEIRAVVAYVPSGALWMGIQVGDAATAVPATGMDLQWPASALYVARDCRRCHRLGTPAGRLVAWICRRSARWGRSRSGDHSGGKNARANSDDLRASRPYVVSETSGDRSAESAGMRLCLPARTPQLPRCGSHTEQSTLPANDNSPLPPSDPRCRR